MRSSRRMNSSSRAAQSPSEISTWKSGSTSWAKIDGQPSSTGSTIASGSSPGSGDSESEHAKEKARGRASRDRLSMAPRLASRAPGSVPGIRHIPEQGPWRLRAFHARCGAPARPTAGRFRCPFDPGLRKGWHAAGTRRMPMLTAGRWLPATIAFVFALLTAACSSDGIFSDDPGDGDPNGDEDGGSDGGDGDPEPTAEVTVCASGDADYAMIADAVADAPAGALLSVCPGIYPERLSIVDKPLLIHGVDGSAATILDAGGAGTALIVSGTS